VVIASRWARRHRLGADTLLTPGTTSFSLSLATQRIDVLGVRLRIVGAGLGGLPARLTSPSGRSVLLDDGTAFTNLPVWQASYPTKAPLESLATLLRAEPAGSWTLTIDNNGAALAFLEDFTLETIGAMVQMPLGSEPQRPAPWLRLGTAIP
jgi:subtilisin-like proprotein convertase family protein